MGHAKMPHACLRRGQRPPGQPPEALRGYYYTYFAGDGRADISQEDDVVPAICHISPWLYNSFGMVAAWCGAMIFA